MIMTVHSVAQDANAVENNYSYFGAFAGYGYIMNATSLQVLRGSADCGAFSDGKASGMLAGLSYDYTLFPKFLQISGRLFFASRPADLTTQTSAYQVFDPIENKYASLVQEFFFQSSLKYLVFDLGAKVFPLEEWPLYVRLSVDAGNPMFGNSVNQYESIIQPESALFPDGTRRRIMFSGEVTGASTSLGANGAIGADFEFQPRWFISPEVSYRHGIGSIVRDAEWKMNIIQARIGVLYELGHPVEKPIKVDTVIPPPPPPPLPPPVTVHSVSSQTLEVQETFVTQTYPLLPYIFFDSARTELSDKYKQNVDDNFNEQSLPRETLTTYYSSLNIIGKRLSRNKDTITIIGATDGRELPSFAQRTKLARERAESVADYFRSAWNIPKERLKIQTRDIPSIPSNDKYVEGIEENRRVELSSKNEQTLSPVIHAKFLEFAPLITQQTLETSVKHSNPASSWNATLTLGTATLGKVFGDGSPPAQLTIPVDASVLTSAADASSNNEMIRGVVQVTFSDGTISEAATQFPLKRSKNQIEVSRLSLIVFDFNRSDISAQNRDMMSIFVNKSVSEKSKVTIVGSTDRLGEKQHNQELSQARAESARELLKQLQPKLNIESAKGIGSSSLQYDNDLPEGRYYCRTVSIEITTPIQLTPSE